MEITSNGIVTKFTYNDIKRASAACSRSIVLY